MRWVVCAAYMEHVVFELKRCLLEEKPYVGSVDW